MGRIRTRSAARTTEHGFTLIELLVVIAIIGVLISLITPAVMSARRHARQTEARTDLQQIAIALNVFQSTGDPTDPPASPQELFDFCAASGACALDAALADGVDNGYRYHFVPMPDERGLVVEAEPAYPGITGDITLILGADGTLSEIPTPGAEERRNAMFSRIFEAGADAIGAMLLAEPDAVAAIHDESRDVPDATAVADRLDCNGDGQVAASETVLEGNQCLVFFLGGIPDLPGEVYEFFEVVSAATKLGAAGEDPTRPAVPGSGFGGDLKLHYFNYETARTVIKVFICPADEPHALGSGCASSSPLESLLSAAERAAARGDAEQERRHLSKAFELLHVGGAHSLATRWQQRVLAAIVKTFQIISANDPLSR